MTQPRRQKARKNLRKRRPIWSWTRRASQRESAEAGRTRRETQEGQHAHRRTQCALADWYDIISEDEYKKVHLGRNDLIAEKSSAAAEGFGVDALRELEKDGVQGKKPDDSAKTPPSSAAPFDAKPPAGPR